MCRALHAKHEAASVPARYRPVTATLGERYDG
jgi:hypothetical protein